MALPRFRKGFLVRLADLMKANIMRKCEEDNHVRR